MTVPVKIEKELKEWQFEDLCKWATWEIIQSMCNGKPLHSSVYYILDVALQWKSLKDKQ